MKNALAPLKGVRMQPGRRRLLIRLFCNEGFQRIAPPGTSSTKHRHALLTMHSLAKLGLVEAKRIRPNGFGAGHWAAKLTPLGELLMEKVYVRMRDGKRMRWGQLTGLKRKPFPQVVKATPTATDQPGV